MPLELIVFYLLATVAVASSMTVIFAKNTIHSALALILLFLNTTFILALFEVEFLALIFLVVYVGAVTVLFLFVVMMVDLRKDSSVKRTFTEKFLMVIAGLFLTTLLLFLASSEFNLVSEITQREKNYDVFYSALFLIRDIDAIASILYGPYMYIFIFIGVILLIAMIGTIHLTLNEEILRIRQAYKNQIYKNPKKVVYLANLKKLIERIKSDE